QAFGWDFSYAGMYEPPKDSREHSALRIEASRNGGKPVELRTPLFVSTTGEAQTVGWPRMIHQWWGDLYVEPHQEDKGEEPLPDVKKGQWTDDVPVPLPDGRTDVIKVRFNDYAIDRSKLP